MLHREPTTFSTGVAMREFKCPKCGGNRWGSHLQDGAFIRMCNGWSQGEKMERCTFSWNESDDGKYFHGVKEAPSPSVPR